MNEILEHWNSYKEKGSGWKGQQKIDYVLKTLIEKELRKGWTAQDIMDAISIFAMVFFEDRYFWTFDGWNLSTWLKRRDKEDPDLKQWYRWHPNSFVNDIHLSKDYREVEVEQTTKEELLKRQKDHYRAEYGVWIEENTMEDIKTSNMWNIPAFQQVVKELK